MNPHRPTNCREALRIAGYPYPKSNCGHCGSILSPGWACPFAAPKVKPGPDSTAIMTPEYLNALQADLDREGTIAAARVGAVVALLRVELERKDRAMANMANAVPKAVQSIAHNLANLTVTGNAVDDNLSTALLSYYESRIDCPDSPERDDETGWNPWALERLAEFEARLTAAIIDGFLPLIDAASPPAPPKGPQG